MSINPASAKMQDNMVRTRIAPSPTGYPHIGTIYQALFDFAFARKNKGNFIIRIEDTDQKRFIKDAEAKLYEAFDWFKISENESPRKVGPYGPYRQSERLKIYKERAEYLIKKGFAYYCFCSKERLDELRNELQKQKKLPKYDRKCRHLTKFEVEEKLKLDIPYVVRLKIPDNKIITVKDEIRGNINFDSNTIDDQVIIKADGFPTYHLAATVDDHLMEITHVVRGEEWLSSTPKHFLLYDYFGWKKPLFFHTPDLRNPDKSKLSKRHGHTNVSWYQEQGYLPDAILNFLALMTWSHPNGKEIFSIEEFISLLELKDLRTAGPVFDITKLDWLNGEYIRQSQNSNLKTQIYDFYNKKYSIELIEKITPLVKERIKKLSDVDALIDFFITKPVTDKTLLIPIKRSVQEASNILIAFIDGLSKLNSWNHESLHNMGNNFVKEFDWKPVELFQMIRIGISGKKVTPPLFESMEIIGKEEVIQRLREANKGLS